MQSCTNIHNTFQGDLGGSVGFFPGSGSFHNSSSTSSDIRAYEAGCYLPRCWRSLQNFVLPTRFHLLKQSEKFKCWCLDSHPFQKVQNLDFCVQNSSAQWSVCRGGTASHKGNRLLDLPNQTGTLPCHPIPAPKGLTLTESEQHKDQIGMSKLINFIK